MRPFFYLSFFFRQRLFVYPPPPSTLLARLSLRVLSHSFSISFLSLLRVLSGGTPHAFSTELRRGANAKLVIYFSRIPLHPSLCLSRPSPSKYIYGNARREITNPSKMRGFGGREKNTHTHTQHPERTILFFLRRRLLPSSRFSSRANPPVCISTHTDAHTHTHTHIYIRICIIYVQKVRARARILSFALIRTHTHPPTHLYMYVCVIRGYTLTQKLLSIVYAYIRIRIVCLCVRVCVCVRMTENGGTRGN